MELIVDCYPQKMDPIFLICPLVKATFSTKCEKLTPRRRPPKTIFPFSSLTVTFIFPEWIRVLPTSALPLIVLTHCFLGLSVFPRAACPYGADRPPAQKLIYGSRAVGRGVSGALLTAALLCLGLVGVVMSFPQFEYQTFTLCPSM